MTKRTLILALMVAIPCAAMSYKPAEEREFSDIAANGCSNRKGDFIIRGMISNATEDTVVLSDPADARSTMSLMLPGRGPLARLKGVFTRSKHEAIKELRNDRMPVVVTLKCCGDGTPSARNISYVNEDGSRGSITF